MTTCSSKSRFQQRVAFTIIYFCNGVSDHLPKATSDRINCSSLQIVYSTVCTHTHCYTGCVQIVYSTVCTHTHCYTGCVQIVYSMYTHSLLHWMCTDCIQYSSIQTHCYTGCVRIAYSTLVYRLTATLGVYRLCMVH